MSLIAAIANNNPLVWIQTREPERVIAQIPTVCQTRSVYVLDPLLGLSKWDGSQWKVILIRVTNMDGVEVQVPIMDPSDAWLYVIQQERALFIVRNAHTVVEDFYNLFSSFYGEYRKAVVADNFEILPLQVIALSPEDEAPVEIASMCTSVKFGYPTESELMGLIDLVNTSYPHDVLKDQNVEKIVSSSRGMTELEAIETYLSSIRAHGVISHELVDQIKLDRMKAHSILDISRPQVTLDDVGGLDKAKELILTADKIWRNPEMAEKYGLTPLRRVLFVGLPGTGKSYICKAAAHKLGLDLAVVGVSKAMNKFVGQSERNMEAAFEQIRALAPIAMWIDELGRDLSGGGSSDSVDGGTTARVHGTFLTQLQELPDNVFLFAAANNLDDLAPEMLRADRFDSILFVGFPSFDERKEIFRLNLTTEVEYDLDALADGTACFTGAEIKDLVTSTKSLISPKYDRHITTQDILTQAPKMRNRLWVKHKGLVMHWYERAFDEYEWASSEQFKDAPAIMRGQVPTRTGKASVAKSTFR